MVSFNYRVCTTFVFIDIEYTLFLFIQIRSSLVKKNIAY